MKLVPKNETLVPLTIAVPKWVKDFIKDKAFAETRTPSQVGRVVIEEALKPFRESQERKIAA